ncbi:response regulator transcription factor [Actinomadura rupiterrae]|uniref:response regulator transcription factor n=1 Tax=Actinomadura rupiterrae TaxID=559627 RepID=UPI0020A614EC|nr:helix-turn-helix transcriptional regulator [Actinomadura rupiterrae]MCP2337455.1 DNA-binding CsgD family transcriptional regulator [Actinomadura rupiterrae]
MATPPHEVAEAPTGAKAGTSGSGVPRDCRVEMFAARPTGPPGGESARRDLALLDGGVRVRLLYPHSVRTDPAFLGYARMFSEAGGEIRTVDRLPAPVAVLDRSLALLDVGPPGAEPVEITAAPVVDQLLWTLAYTWDHGWRCPGDGEPEELRTAILFMLANGDKDETIARRLGMSVRTCRRHVASIMAELNAASRFQAGLMAARVGLLGTPPHP